MLHRCFLQMHFYCEGCHGTVQSRVLVVTLSVTYLLIINPSALLCPGSAGAEPALDRETCHWAWCWKPQGNFAGQREIRNLCTPQHHVPECLHVHRNCAAVYPAECLHSCWMYLCSPVCMWHDLHKPAPIHASVNISCIVTEQFLLLLKGIVENLQYNFRDG